MDGSCPYFPFLLRVTKTPAVRARTLDRRGFYAAVPHLPPPKLGPKPTRLMIVLAGVGAMLSVAAAAEKFQKLSGSQIRAKLAGMEITDEVHWADVYGAGGTLTTFSMGKKTIGKWSVRRDELCHDRGREFQGCYQVWASGKKVELRREGSSLPLEGVLQPPARRK
jgi:hypothetical protein